MTKTRRGNPDNPFLSVLVVGVVGYLAASQGWLGPTAKQLVRGLGAGGTDPTDSSAAVAAAIRRAAADLGYDASGLRVAEVRPGSIPVSYFTSGCPPTMPGAGQDQGPTVAGFYVAVEKSLATPALPHAVARGEYLVDATGTRVMPPCVYGL